MFYMALNMKAINFRTFRYNFESLHAFSRAEVDKNQALARNEVRKTYSNLDDVNDAV